MKLKLITGCLLLLMLSGCIEFPKKKEEKVRINRNLAGNWRLFDLSEKDTKSNDHGDDLLAIAQSKKMIKQGIILSFFQDGAFTEIKGNGNYRTGTWRYLPKAKKLYLADSVSTDTITITQEVVNSEQTLQLQYASAPEQQQFVQQMQGLDKYQDDPFYPRNNLWRIRPIKRETSVQLQDRLANYFQHILYILKTAKERKLEVVSFEFSLGIIKIYNGGIGINPIDIVPETWKAAFFDDKDAMTAYHMFKTYLNTNNYKGASAGDWIQDDYNILLSIYGDLKEGKFPDK